MEILIVNKVRYLINTEAPQHHQDADCQRILKQYPLDAIVEWDEVPTKEDLATSSLKDLVSKSKAKYY